ncbi:MAG: hypothetical protein HUU29_12750 [Planctomycetaceae bacterium]|nr:hypothetical protein [Planctomycetaceae bacterium]
MKPSDSQSRKDYILLVVPALLTALVYYTQVDIPLSDEYKTVAGPQNAAPGVDTNAMYAAQSQDLQKRVNALATEIETLKNKKAAYEKKLDEALAPMTDSARRPQTVKDVNELLAKHRLRMVTEQPGETKDLPPTLKSIADFIVERGIKNGPEMRILRVSGQYLDVLAALEEITKRELPVIPVNLTMHALESGQTVRTWTLILWV